MENKEFRYDPFNLETWKKEGYEVICERKDECEFKYCISRIICTDLGNTTNCVAVGLYIDNQEYCYAFNKYGINPNYTLLMKKPKVLYYQATYLRDSDDCFIAYTNWFDDKELVKGLIPKNSHYFFEIIEHWF